MPKRRRLTAFYLGRRRYEPIHELQRALVLARGQGAVDDVILLLEHEPVVTLGRSAKAENLLFDSDALRERGVDLVETGRGGDVTFHGPGQLVAYPIVDLRPDRCDLRRYVRGLTDVMASIARDHHVEAGTADGMIGLWADAAQTSAWAGLAWASRPTKIGAIGVRVSRWITMHGFALNLDVDLDYFNLIVPCGIRDYSVASIAKLTGSSTTVASVAPKIGPHFSSAMDLDVPGVQDLSSLTNEELLAAIVVAASPPPIKARGDF